MPYHRTPVHTRPTSTPRRTLPRVRLVGDYPTVHSRDHSRTVTLLTPGVTSTRDEPATTQKDKYNSPTSGPPPPLRAAAPSDVRPRVDVPR